MARRKPSQSGDMDEEARQVEERRARLGMPKAALAREAGVSRTTLRAILSGEGSHRSTMAKVKRALDRLEREVGMDVAPLPNHDQGLMSIEVELPGGRTAKVTVKAGADPERVAQQVRALMRQFEEQNKTRQNG
jgi:DNA-binding XRE family transcriptional regulator